MATSTATETLHTTEDIPLEVFPPQAVFKGGRVSEKPFENASILEPALTREASTPPEDAFEAKVKWNSPPINKYRVFSTFWSFFVLGMNDGSYGALVPQLETHYNLTYTVVSLIFLSPFVGYTMAAFVNSALHVRLGQRGVAMIAPAFRLVPYLVISFHPPFPVLIVMYILVGFGNGIVDAAWSAWIGNMANSHEVSGILQACYALGATVAPLIATSISSHGHGGWWTFYYIMVSASALEFGASTSTFWTQTGAVYLSENPHQKAGGEGSSGRTREALKNKLTWFFSLFIFLYVGTEVSIGGWIVVFMTKVRNASTLAGSATATGFWGGMTVGRFILGFVTSRLGGFRAMLLYLGLAIVIELVFWLVPNMVVTAVASAFLGMILGPIYPTAVVLMTTVLPRSLHISAIGFATAVGGSGSAALPFAVGAIAQAKGVKTLQPIVLASCVVMLTVWLFLQQHRPKDKEEGFSMAIFKRMRERVQKMIR
ncbi:major facilitator superfamily domain-containing protein [Trichoderma evansii]